MKPFILGEKDQRSTSRGTKHIARMGHGTLVDNGALLSAGFF